MLPPWHISTCWGRVTELRVGTRWTQAALASQHKPTPTHHWTEKYVCFMIFDLDSVLIPRRYSYSLPIHSFLFILCLFFLTAMSLGNHILRAILRVFIIDRFNISIFIVFAEIFGPTFFCFVCFKLYFSFAFLVWSCFLSFVIYFIFTSLVFMSSICYL